MGGLSRVVGLPALSIGGAKSGDVLDSVTATTVTQLITPNHLRGPVGALIGGLVEAPCGLRVACSVPLAASATAPRA
jgi:hypothetical protein